MESLYAPQLEREDRRLELTCPRSLIARCDPALLRRILWNLLENARLHGAGNESLSLMVQDQGVGLDAKEWTRVFEPFARGPGAGDGRVPGIGLGLAFVRRLGRAMGGDCRILPSDQGFLIEVSLMPARAPNATQKGTQS